jgi:hypothetical protein
MSPHRYTRDHVIRDIVYFFHLCAQYHGLPTDAALYGSVVSGPYEQFFEGEDPHDPEDRLIREGSLLIFLGMLDDWDASASFSFAEISPGGHASLTAYLAALLRAYEHARERQDERITFLCEEALALLASIERRGHWARELADVDPQVWARLLAVTREYETSPDGVRHTQRDLYDDYVGAYFAERCP